jgi:lipoate-protein ligase A
VNKWQLIVSPEISGLLNMQADITLFEDHENCLIPSTLRIYSWRPKCISLGYSQQIEEEIDIEKASQLGWDIVKRPTGGGIVFHNEAEITYSLVTAIDNPILPKGLVPSYKKISEAIIAGLSKIGICAQIQNSKIQIQNKSQNPKIKTQNNLCFSYPAEYEVVVDGKKIVGSAQKRGRRTLFQQGSIFVRETEEEAFSIMKRPFDDPNAVSVEKVIGREIRFEKLNDALIKGFKEKLELEYDEK